ncbi:uncharacterized protein LAJ45_07087 [Morchella importuna]|uniref:uncharacterized protein n=1 Tax=Morchella importuna TaxID=1174673 RepID=UPI001E8E42A6|nr:uncharacterized protein LAJ45_07087 [Morchella importuna]KAH8148744.1 hypothetical protein LAJ45_07087 [Morchella importuna]
MEDSPLTLAHQHASTASNILRSSAPPHAPSTLLAAASSHALASTSFAAAAKLTKDPEALRTLDLLSTEHDRWGARLRLEAERPVERFGAAAAAAALETVVEGSGSTENINDDADAASRSRPSGARDSLPPAPLPFANTGTAPIPPRLQKSTSSLATNLASARGIPQQSRLGSGGGATSPSRRRSLFPERSQTLPTAHDYHTTTSSSSSKPTTNPLTLLPPDDPTPPPPPKRASTTPRLSTRASAPDLTSSTDEPFSKFYTSLNTLVSRIGSPFAASLAFAGLPLTDDPASPAPDADAPALLPRGWTAGRAAAGGGGSSGGGAGTAPAAGAESFYVVPVSGGTLSYAGVVRRGDAGRKTKEELQLENTGLRQTIDHMSRTMQSWQRKTRESECALKNSILAMGPGAERELLSQVQRRSWMHVPYEEGEDDGAVGVGVGAAEERVGVLEEELEGVRREVEGARREAEAARREAEEWRREAEACRRENEKLKTMLEKLKAKWERLKEGARSRKAAGAGGGSGSAGALGRVEEGE